MTKISFIGSGNVAWHLAPALDNAGYVVREVYSPNHQHAADLTDRLYQAEVKSTLDFSTSDSEIFIVCVKDAVIGEVAREIILPEDAFLVHTSGSVPLSELQYAATSNLGVFYPLQTFSKSKKVDFKSLPIFIESNNEETGELLLKLAHTLTSQVRKISSHERRALHVAAVFASNFSNYMLTAASEIMQQNSLDFEWLKPLIAETITKSLQIGPMDAQTGPARRGDLEILDQHMEFLQDDPQKQEVYKLISQLILDKYQPD